MNFYPIYKNKKLLPWIKYWLLKGNKVLPKVLSEVIEGTTPITIEGVYKGTSLQELVFKGQTIQEGTPSPEEPIPIQVVKEDNYININEDSFRVNLSGKNLFDVELATSKAENRGGSLVNGWGGYEDGIVTNNKSMGQFGICCFAGQKFTLKPNESYTLSATVYLSGTNETSRCLIGFVDIKEETKTITKEVWTNISVTFTNNSEEKTDVRTVIEASNTGNIVQIKNIQLEKNSEPTAYEPYYDYELCKIGDYQDSIYKENDKWYLEKNVGKAVLNGSESGFRTSSQTSGNYRMCIDIGTNILSGDANLTAPIYSDKFIGITRNQSYTEVQGIAPTDTGFNYKSLIIYCDATKNMTYAEFQTWLSTHNTTIYYVSAEPTTTEITDATLISQLEAIKNASLISGTNEITQTPSDLPFILNFKYYMKG